MALDNGACTYAVFQVADVTRPLLSVARLCELGNRVLFGKNGGVIKNMRTGNETKFTRRDGIYTFVMWVPSPSMVNMAPGFIRQP